MSRTCFTFELAKTIGAVRSHLTVSERGRMILVAVEEIVYLRAELKYVTIKTPTREYLTEESLTSLETEFGDRFVRIHRSYIVNLDQVGSIEPLDTGDARVHLRNAGAAPLPCSRRYRDGLRGRTRVGG